MKKSTSFIIFWAFSLMWLKGSQGIRHSIRIVGAGERLYFADVEWEGGNHHKGIINIHAYPDTDLYYLFGVLENTGSMIKMSGPITNPDDKLGHFIRRPLKLTKLQASADARAEVVKAGKYEDYPNGYLTVPFNKCELEEETPLDYVFYAVYQGQAVSFIASIVQSDSRASKKWRYTLGSGNKLAKEWVVVRRPYPQNGIQLDLAYVRNVILELIKTNGVFNVYELTDEDQFTDLISTPFMKIKPKTLENIGIIATLTHTKSLTFEFEMQPN